MIDLYRNAWSQACDDLTGLFDSLGDDDLNTATDCPGWTVRDVIAHLAHLEAVLAGIVTDRQPEMSGSASQVTAQYTEDGVAERKDWSFAELVDEFTRAVGERRTQLDSLTEDAPAPVTPAGIDWSWETLLRNRVIDAWVHDQDIRRAVNHPGGMDLSAAHVTATTFSHALPVVLAKRVGASPGTAVRWIVEGTVPFDFTIAVGDDGRADFADDDSDNAAGADATLQMTSEEFTILGAGRRAPEQLDVTISGDTELGHKVLANMAVTP